MNGNRKSKVINVFRELFVFIFRHFKWLNILVWNEPCLCICVSVCVCVCVCVCLSVTAFCLNTIRPILMKLGQHDLIEILRWFFSQILKMLLRWRHSGHFICFRMWHSHCRNFASILSKIIDKKGCCLLCSLFCMIFCFFICLFLFVC